MNLKNIVLFGFMGVGKSVVAQQLADQLRWKWVDMDQKIEAQENKSIAELFDAPGEAYFRGLERTLVQQLCVEKDAVISTGGGVVLNPNNVHDFSQNGLCVCLNEEIDVVFERIKGQNHRPLLKGKNPLHSFRELWIQRKALYQVIPHQIACEERSVDKIVDQILRLKDEI